MATRKKGGATRSTADVGGRSRRDPVIGVEVVDALPASGHHLNARTMRYANAMAEVRATVGAGQWVRIATFDSPDGAAGVRRAILRGERVVDGDLGDWDIETRRVADGGGSELYVQLNKKPRAKRAVAKR